MTDQPELVSLDGSEEDEDIPDVATCQMLVEQFAKITNTDEACAQFFLQDRKWDLEHSVNAYFESTSGGIKVLKDGDEPEVVVTFDSKMVSVLERGSITVKPPDHFCFITWNIDGLDEKNLKKRTKAVARTIEHEKADIVFLQEVVPQTYTYLQDLLPHFAFIVGNTVDYFTATLLRRTTVHFDGHDIITYPNTVMNRNLLCVEAHIGKVKMQLLNTHLESTKEFAGERMTQLKSCFKKMHYGPSDVTMILAGDLNIRDTELAKVGQPDEVRDLWEQCGARPECQWTWDTRRNTNKQLSGKPRLRFDRVYLRGANPPTITPTYFGLIGLEKVQNTQSFPSDHWGIVTRFQVVGQDEKPSPAPRDQPSCSTSKE